MTKNRQSAIENPNLQLKTQICNLNTPICNLQSAICNSLWV